MPWLLLASSFALAACPQPVPPAVLAEAIAEAERHFAAEQPIAFRQAAERAHAALPCLSEPLTPTLAGAWHRLGALEALVTVEADDRPRAVAALRAMLAADPAYVFPAGLAGEGSLLRPYLEEARRAGPAPTAPMPVPDRSFLFIDGRRASDRPFEQPMVVQLQWREDLVVHYTAALEPGAPLPDWSALGVLPPDPPRRLGRPATLALTGGALALGAASGGALGWGLANKAAFDDPSTPDGQLGALVDRSHSLSLVSAGTAAGALALAGLVLAVGEF